jgi:ribonuclease VapC
VIIDTSAVLAILFREPGYEALERAIVDAPSCSISAAGFVEVSMVVESRGGDQGLHHCDSLIRRAGIAIEPITVDQAFLARQAYSEYGKGRHPAGLNFGDCFAYALAKSTGEPLLFTGNDFRQTDLQSAI